MHLYLATLEAEFPNGVYVIRSGGNYPLIGGWIVWQPYNPA